MPLYFLLLVHTGPFEAVAWRVIFSLGLCAVLVTVVRGWKRLIALLKQPRVMLLTAAAGVLIFVNWQMYLIGTLSGHVVETSLGYFMNPIVTVLLSVIVLRERLRRLQWVAIALAVAAVAVIVAALGTVPWIAITLSLSFAVYGLVKNRLGGDVDAVSGLTLETMWLTPIAVVELLIVNAIAGLTLTPFGTGYALIMVGLGIATAVPLLLFAAGARRIPLSLVGMLQFIAPILKFLIGVFIQHEEMPVERWIGFSIVWAAVAVFLLDMALAGAGARRAATSSHESGMNLPASTL